MKKFKNLIKNLAIMLGVVLTSLLLLEFVIRIFYVEPPGETDLIAFSFFSEYFHKDDELGWLPKKNIHGTHNKRGSFSTTFRTNSRGLRDKEYDLNKTEGKKRIVIVGDSFTWGFGVNDDEIYSERLESMLSNTEVINLGVTAF